MVYDIVTEIFKIIRRYKRENEALRSILQKLGKSEAQVRREVIGYTRVREQEDTALEMLTSVCTESLEYFATIRTDSDLDDYRNKKPN